MEEIKKLAARKHSDRITVIDSANLSGGFSMHKSTYTQNSLRPKTSPQS